MVRAGRVARVDGEVGRDGGRGHRGGGVRGGRALRGRELLLAGHHTVRVDHHTRCTQAVVKVVRVEGRHVLASQLVGRPLRRVVQHLVHIVVPGVELEGGVNTVQVVEQVQGINIAKTKLV